MPFSSHTMSVVRGLKMALNASGKYVYKAPEAGVDFLVIGGGVVGLAIAQRLSQRYPSKTTFLVERHAHAGEETRQAASVSDPLLLTGSYSSRNSEVIHAGLYYPDDSLKTRLCLRGRDLLYERCENFNIPYRRVGKLVVALAHQHAYIEKLHSKSFKLKWPPYSKPSHVPVLPTQLLTGDQAREYEPDLSKDIAGALWSPTTGIVDSHAYMTSLEKDIVESEGGQLIYSTRVVRLDSYKRTAQKSNTADVEATEDGWVAQFVTEDSERSDALFARIVINAAGLSSAVVLNSILPDDKKIPMYYARGSYGSYQGPGVSQVSHLIYPCPETRGTAHGFHSLGTHLTLDLNGKVKFGPDIQWISPPNLQSLDDDQLPDFWSSHLVPNDKTLPEMYEAVKTYLPGIVPKGFQPDYVGIRPKISGPGAGFQDFIFREDYPSENTRNPMVSLLNIESPGLTSSLAIAEYVVEDIVGKYKI